MNREEYKPKFDTKYEMLSMEKEKRGLNITYKPMPKERERKLIKDSQEGDKEALNILVVNNIPIIKKTAGAYVSHNHSLDWDDLIDEGVMGFRYGVLKFDLTYNVRLVTYGVIWAKQYIRRAIQTQGYPIRVPVGVMDDSKEKPIKVLFPWSLNLPAQDVKDSGARMSTPLQELIPHEGNKDVEEELDLEILVGVTKEALKTLPERHRFILVERNKGRTLEDIGEEIGLTRERIRQIESGTLKALRFRIKKRLMPAHEGKGKGVGIEEEGEQWYF